MLPSGRLPSLASLGAFEAVARCGSFAAAARDLGTSSASVSYHIRQLELQTGLSLFQRFPHRVMLTEVGRDIAEEAIAAFKRLRDSLTRAAKVDSSRLALSALPTFGVSWLAPRLGAFSDRYVNFYLSKAHRDAREYGCPLPALSGDLARLKPAARKRFAKGVAVLTGRLSTALTALGLADADVEASALLSQMVGAVALSRAVDGEASDAVLTNARKSIMSRFELEGRP